jgi:hypothetical protein
VIQFLHSLSNIFGFNLISASEKCGHLAMVNLALSFHMVLIYVRTKTVLQAMRKSVIPLNFLALVHVGCFAADFSGYSPLLQVFISAIDLYCTWIFYTFIKELRATRPNKNLDIQRQQSVIHQKASIRLCLCSAIGGIATILAIVVYDVLFYVDNLTANVVYFIAYNIFEVSFALCGILWVRLKIPVDLHQDQAEGSFKAQVQKQDEKSMAELTGTSKTFLSSLTSSKENNIALINSPQEQ